ncbi:MAG: hypothetical protein HYW24_00130 [Candidatus Aenigmarchaeota archaeon]|nr:hypothetical protein [Candidatus Aenigmarchaeota archaeon]
MARGIFTIPGVSGDVNPIETPYGRVFVLEKKGLRSKEGLVRGGTIACFYVGHLTNDRTRLTDVSVLSVPYDKQDDVAEILRNYGYREPIKFW